VNIVTLTGKVVALFVIFNLILIEFLHVSFILVVTKLFDAFGLKIEMPAWYTTVSIKPGLPFNHIFTESFLFTPFFRFLSRLCFTGGNVPTSFNNRQTVYYEVKAHKLTSTTPVIKFGLSSVRALFFASFFIAFLPFRLLN
jgi:hypothetical protein